MASPWPCREDADGPASLLFLILFFLNTNAARLEDSALGSFILIKYLRKQLARSDFIAGLRTRRDL